ncbi:hypothetical protein EG68_00525 [Paragonimus skrjabini miyazakii]|uniref:Uncharacterized protein n=1 Tax=Paragonimus skrjabini miyazakii TaxID=59628 RepID=A0A8S9Z9F3_9TREM|nr:hypothetical protein EG68_00525 [Paragonimus skrjabini miyazakii]
MTGVEKLDICVRVVGVIDNLSYRLKLEGDCLSARDCYVKITVPVNMFDFSMIVFDSQPTENIANRSLCHHLRFRQLDSVRSCFIISCILKFNIYE